MEIKDCSGESFLILPNGWAFTFFIDDENAQYKPEVEISIKVNVIAPGQTNLPSEIPGYKLDKLFSLMEAVSMLSSLPLTPEQQDFVVKTHVISQV